MVIIPWGYYYSEIIILPFTKSFVLDYYYTSGEWELKNTSIQRYFRYGELISVVLLNITIKRKSTYYMMMNIAPVLILCALNPFVFVLPAESGERVSYTITSFLSLAVFMTIISDDLPKSAAPMANLCFYLIAILISSAMMAIATLFSLWLYYKEDVEHIPKWLRCSVSMLSCRCCNSSNQIQYTEDDASSTDIASDEAKTNAQTVAQKNAWEEKFNHETEKQLSSSLMKADILKYVDRIFFIFFNLLVWIVTAAYFTSLSI